MALGPRISILPPLIVQFSIRVDPFSNRRGFDLMIFMMIYGARRIVKVESPRGAGGVDTAGDGGDSRSQNTE